MTKELCTHITDMLSDMRIEGLEFRVSSVGVDWYRLVCPECRSSMDIETGQPADEHWGDRASEPPIATGAMSTNYTATLIRDRWPSDPLMRELADMLDKADDWTGTTNEARFEELLRELYTRLGVPI